MQYNKNRSFILIALALCASLVASCTVVKIGEEDGESGDQYATWTKTGTGFDAVQYVEAVWDEQVLPAFEADAVDFQTLMARLRSDRPSATAEYGLVRESGEPAATFMVKGSATIVGFDDSSRNGLFLLDLPPADGVEDITMQVGPVIRGTAIRDSLAFIQFTDVGNQIQFAALANELNARMMKDSVEPLDLTSVAGMQVEYLGAFKIAETESLDDIVITPVSFGLIGDQG